MKKLPFSPEVRSYSITEGSGRSFQEQLDSPMPQTGKGFVNTAFLVQCTFELDADEFESFSSFFEGAEPSPAYGMPFLCDLILDRPVIEECQCKFNLGTVKVTNRGGLYSVSCTILAQR